jgi:glucose-6-phosphate isomerase
MPRSELVDPDPGGLSGSQAVRRLFAGDHTLWRDDPTEISDRLGWIPVVGEIAQVFHTVRERCDAIARGLDHIVLMGMGGSSLFPEVLARTFPRQEGYPQLHVLDTTHPAAIARMAQQCPADRTLYVASSKSGTTIETRSHLDWFFEQAGGEGRFAVITDPGSELGALAHERAFAQVFENRPDIGGRYSALSLFGMVPAMLAGMDAEGLIRGGLLGLQECGPDEAPGMNPGLTLGRQMANGVAVGHDKLTFRLPDEVATFGLWLEQLVAESLGKDGSGLVPIVGERPGPPKVYGDDRTYVDLGVVATPESIGRAVVVAEIATALCGAFIGIHPFDQPDVAAAKKATNDVLTNKDSHVAATPLPELLRHVQPGWHVAIQAFVDPEGEHVAALEEARLALRDELKVAVSLGFGPRYLHSTGQLHKGGPPEIVCIQVLDDHAPDLTIPGRGIGFGELMAAQAAGDLKVLTERGRTAGRVELRELLEVAS